LSRRRAAVALGVPLLLLIAVVVVKALPTKGGGVSGGPQVTQGTGVQVTQSTGVALCSLVQDNVTMRELARSMAELFGPEAATARAVVRRHMSQVVASAQSGPEALRRAAAEADLRVTRLLAEPPPDEQDVEAAQRSLIVLGEEVQRACG
jgi:hypothetical protein